MQPPLASLDVPAFRPARRAAAACRRSARPRLAPEPRLGVLRALSRAVDAKDPSTHRHSERVGTLAGRLALAEGWSPAGAARVQVAGLLHDVGKIGVPDEVLFKPAALDCAEYELVKEHAALGAEIVAEVLSVEETLWVRHHHERWDGRGYPDGLSGRAIPRGARLIAVADAWDVMLTARPYCQALSPKEALAECRAEAGRQFCPEAVAALERLWHQGRLGDGPADLCARRAPAAPAGSRAPLSPAERRALIDILRHQVGAELDEDQVLDRLEMLTLAQRTLVREAMAQYRVWEAQGR